MSEELNAQFELCPVCGEACVGYARAKILGKYEIQYYSCDTCGSVHTERPFWLEEAYSDTVCRYDTGAVARSLALSKRASLILRLLAAEGPYVDFGGGTGLYVRLMRDLGFDFRWYDKYAPNVFAKGFEAKENLGASVVTAFEVFEHLPDPQAVIREMLAMGKTILFTTQTLPSSQTNPNEWYYFSLHTGQHITLYTREGLTRLGQRFSLLYSADGKGLHLLTPSLRMKRLFALIGRLPLKRLWWRLAARRSLTVEDWALLDGRAKDSRGTSAKG